MDKLIELGIKAQKTLLEITKRFEFSAPLLLRIFLAPIFIMAGYKKISDLESTAYYFGEFLGLPAPDLMAVLAGSTEFIGGIALLIGIGVRWFSIPLMFTMIIAATTAHWENGWHALPETQLTMPWEWRTDLIEAASNRKEIAKSILEEHGNYNWLTETGPFTILKNGIEFAATYFIMLLTLLFTGAGKASIDHFIKKRYMG